MIERRKFLIGLGAGLVAAPMVIRNSSILMPVKDRTAILPGPYLDAKMVMTYYLESLKKMRTIYDYDICNEHEFCIVPAKPVPYVDFRVDTRIINSMNCHSLLYRIDNKTGKVTPRDNTNMIKLSEVILK